MLDTLLLIALFIQSLAALGCMYRVIKGPSVSDRVVALDSMGISLISITAMLSVLLRSQSFMDIILLIGILAFIGTIAYSKFIERGVVIDRNRRGK
ncbi:Na(+)/H(+) antiporter subunit F [Xylanibacillus composti]|uniref:Na(+)/H(+) antiporter subunit F n=1 Tax=Xylanibacillus composti TaxID=1572762 RepID=A0A8J4M437_9BACL|nr:Na(+)/H(+) antiporter subunit F1 [Xylanibacillus composti]GIQ70146.1 Na(+)/H(+) antiporter subunit F [Xylanibacillus composti]